MPSSERIPASLCLIVVDVAYKEKSRTFGCIIMNVHDIY